MEYVVFLKSSPHTKKKYFKTASAAKRSATCSNRKYGTDDYDSMELTFFMLKYPVRMITVKNLMTGEQVNIPEDTPYFMRPDSETYWSS